MPAAVARPAPDTRHALDPCRLVDIGRREGLRRLHAAVLAANGPMQKVCRRLAFRIEPTADRDEVQATIELSAGAGGHP